MGMKKIESIIRCTQDTENNSIFLVCLVINLLQKDIYDFLNFYLFKFSLFPPHISQKILSSILKNIFEKMIGVKKYIILQLRE